MNYLNNSNDVNQNYYTVESSDNYNSTYDFSPQEDNYISFATLGFIFIIVTIFVVHKTRDIIKRRKDKKKK